MCDGLLGLTGAHAAGRATVAHAAALRPAGVGRDHHVDARVRSDRIGWLDGAMDDRFVPLFDLFEALRRELNARAYLGLATTEVQLGHYAVGGTYVRHLDAFAGQPGRVITAIWYANPDWQAAHGGRLCVWDPGRRRLAPLLDRLIVFRSAAVAHEVETCHHERFAVTAWFAPRCLPA